MGKRGEVSLFGSEGQCSQDDCHAAKDAHQVGDQTGGAVIVLDRCREDSLAPLGKRSRRCRAGRCDQDRTNLVRQGRHHPGVYAKCLSLNDIPWRGDLRDPEVLYLRSAEGWPVDCHLLVFPGEHTLRNVRGDGEVHDQGHRGDVLGSGRDLTDDFVEVDVGDGVLCSSHARTVYSKRA